MHSQYGTRSYLGERRRDGFETSLLLENKVVEAVSADAISADGHVLTSTEIVSIQNEVLPPYSLHVGEKDGHYESSKGSLVEQWY